MTTTDSRRSAVPAPRPVPDPEIIVRPDDEPPDWAAGYPLVRYAVDRLRARGISVDEG